MAKKVELLVVKTADEMFEIAKKYLYDESVLELYFDYSDEDDKYTVFLVRNADAKEQVVSEQVILE